MSFERKVLKQDAKKALSGKYGFAIMALCIMLLFQMGIGIVTVLFASVSTWMSGFVQFIGQVYLMITLNFGLVILFYKIGKNEEVTNTTILDGFKNRLQYLNVIVLYIFISLFVSLWTLLLIVPGIIAAIRYSQAPFIMLENPGMTALEAIRQSKAMTKGHKWEIFMLSLSFLGWSILSVFTFGILYFWLIPYIGETNAQLYFFLKNAMNENVTAQNTM